MDKNDDNNMMRNHHQQPQPQIYSQQLLQTASFNQGNQQLKKFWYEQMEAVEDFKTHQLPLARIKKIMKSDPDVRMISAEAPMLFAKACEMFIVDLTMRSWVHAEENKRRALQKPDISTAVARTFAFDFLLDVVPRDESVAGDPAAYVAVPHLENGGVPYYYPQVGGGMYVPQQQVGHSWPSPWPAVNGGDGDDEEGGISGGNSGEC